MYDYLKFVGMRIGLSIAVLLTISLSSCKTSVIKEFPKVEPELMYTSLIFEEKCFVRCYDVREAATVAPMECGVGDPQDVEEDLSWEVNYEACDEITGFKQKAWSHRLVPYFEEVSDWVYDNLGLIQSKINKLMEE